MRQLMGHSYAARGIKFLLLSKCRNDTAAGHSSDFITAVDELHFLITSVYGYSPQDYLTPRPRGTPLSVLHTVFNTVSA